MDSIKAIQEFKKLVSNVEKNSVKEFLAWIQCNIEDVYDANNCPKQNSDVMLDSIREEMREMLPVNATSPTERILTPVSGPNSDCDPSTTVHVDAFLYDDDVIDSLCDDGKMSRNYCQQCGSKEISPLTFITHSASVKQIKYMFRHLLPDLGGKAVLDVGSRTGAVLYGAYLYSDASRIVGVELDKKFCELQQKMVEKYKFSDRIEILHQNVRDYVQYLKDFDVIILNNVFEFFMNIKVQRQVWQSLYKHIKKPGTMLITIPDVQESLDNIQMDLNLSRWLKEVDVKEVCKQANLLLYGQEDPDDEELSSIHLYEVLPRT
ncbi:uncharacterized protein LOC117322893 isoform X1 [Pecten maximus]|uniref:uncharacterized protein LOC117322893 isoform X1 n=2 Tax=Pecten maximus TaxID=6579 RepID=UPI001458FCF3|nr:uncharacterized protein LOC117322893 isoform X1 [Pecten maximus]XP_033733726.1 uncharacterized protein LOC117322893 isoform X1 [Pecten maximus]